MKRILPVYKIIVPLACTVLVAGFTVSARAEKGGETLIRLAKGTPAAVTEVKAAAPAMHRCPTCKDTWTTVVDQGTKGPRHAVNRVVRHECSACETKIVTEGVGKAKRNVAMHRCGTIEAAALCCASK